MAVDLKLLHLSDGKYGIQDLMRDMSAEYGVDTPFEDDKLFLELGRVSNYLKLTPFLEKHVGDTVPLPYDELLGYAGIEYAESKTVNTISGGGAAVGYNPRSDRMVVVGINQMDDFGKDLGFEVGDELISWNGEEVNSDNFRKVLDAFKNSVSEKEKVTVTVARKKEDGSYEEKTLKAKTVLVERTLNNYWKLKENPSPEEQVIRDAWLKG
jgi:hypothetical protein